jgi:integrase/recombinase XerD
MTEFDRHVRDYLKLRRALGFKLRREGQLLVQLAVYLEQAGTEHLNTELALRWAQLPQNVAPINWAHRLGAARGFAAYLKTIDPATEIPPRGCSPPPRPARRPTSGRRKTWPGWCGRPDSCGPCCSRRPMKRCSV